MTHSSSQLALVVTLVSCGFAAAMVCQMAYLLWRRRRLEARMLAERPRERALLRELMSVAERSGNILEASAFFEARPRLRLSAITHLLQMVRGADRDAVLRLAEQASIYEEAVADLDRVDFARRIDALRVLEQVPVAASIDAIRGIMGSDPNHDVRIEAAAALARMGQLPPPEVVIRMLELTTRPLMPLHEAMFRSSAPLHGQQLARLAIDLRYVRVRALLVEALGWSGDYGLLAQLEGHGGDPDPEVRCAALKAARRLGHPGAGRWGAALLLDPVDSVRIQAAQTCAKLGVRDAVPVLASLIANPSWWVRMRAKEALDILRPGQRATLTAPGPGQ